MSFDTRTAMREFRFLDEKRKLGSFSVAEEQRWNELRQALGAPEPAAPAYPSQEYAAAQSMPGYADQAAQGYYAADGNWYPYTPQEQQAYAEQPAYDQG